MILEKTKKWMNRMEEYPVGIAGWSLIFMSVVFLRDVLEGFSGEIPFVHPIDFFIHYPLAFLNPILALSIVLAVFSGVRITRVTKLMFFVSVFVFMMPPVLDIVMSLISGKEGGSHIGYLYLERSQYKDYIINFFNPLRHFQGTTSGIRIESFVSCLLAFIYVVIKSGKVLRALTASLTIYFVSFFFFTYPYNWYHLFMGKASSMSGVRAFFDGNGIIIRHFFDPQSFSFATLHIILLAFLSTLWLFVMSPVKFFMIVWKGLSRRFLFTVFLAAFGGVAAYNGLYPSTGSIQRETWGLFDYVSVVQIALILFYVNIFRSFIVEWGRRVKRYPYLDRDFVLTVAVFSAGMALLLSMALHYAAFTIVMTMEGTIVLLYLKPLKLRRWPVTAAAAEGLFWMLSLMLGLAVFLRGDAPALMVRRFAWISFATLYAFSLWRFSNGNKRTLTGVFIEDFPFLKIIEKVERFLPWPALLVASIGPAFLFHSFGIAVLGLVTGILSASSRVYGKWGLPGKLLFPFSMIILLGLIFRAGLENPSLTTTVMPASSAVRYHGTLAHKFLWDGKSEHAMVEYETAVAAGSGELEHYTTLAFLYGEKNDNDKALAIARLAAERFPNDPDAGKFLAGRLMMSNLPMEAAEEYERVVSLERPNPDVDLLQKTALAFEAAGVKSDALKYLEEAKSVNPSDMGINEAYWHLVFSMIPGTPGDESGKDALFWKNVYVNSNDIDSLYMAGRFLEKTGMYSDAAECYKKIFEEHPDEVPALYLHSRLLSGTKKYSEAIKYMKEVLSKTNGFRMPVMDLAMLFRAVGKQDSARQLLYDYDSRQDVDYPGRGVVEINLGLLTVETGDPDEGAFFLERALSDSTLDAAVRNSAGIELADIVSKSLDKFTLVKESGGKLSELCDSPLFVAAASDTVLGDAFARSLVEKKMPAEAICAYYRLTTEFPNYVRALFNFAKILERMGRLQDALVLYEKICSVKVDNPNAWLRRAECLVKLGRVEDGLSAAKFSLKINPHFERARRLVDELEKSSNE